MLRVALVFALTLISVGASYAQSELIPLQQYIDLPANRRTPTYPLVRCAGMHSGLLTYGVANSAPDKGRAGERAAHILAMAAIYIRVNNNEGTIDAISQNVTDSVILISNLYLQRLKDNYARVGQAFGADQLVKSDLDLCKVAAEAVMEKLPEVVKAVDDGFLKQQKAASGQ